MPNKIVSDRVSSGIPAIDSVIDGGFPKGSVISYFGKATLHRKYCMLKFLAQEGNSLYINTKNTVDIILKEAEKHNIFLSSTYFLDGVHWRNKRVNPKLNTPAMFEVNNLTDLNALLAKIMDACKTQQITRIVFDSPSSILLYTTPGPEQVYKFFELLNAFLRQNQINMIYTLEDGIHSDSIVNTLHYLSDGVLFFEIEKKDQEFIPIVEVREMLLTSQKYNRIILDQF